MSLLASSSREAPAHGQAWGKPYGGLRIGIATVNRDSASSADVQFEVAFENIGTADFVLNLGYMLANGKVMLPFSVRLVLTDPSGQTRELQFAATVAGRLDDFTVSLRVGSVYTIRVAMDQYWSPSSKEFDVKLTRGRYRVLARFQGEGARTRNSDMPGLALMNFWKGTVQSNPLEFDVSSTAAPGEGDTQ